MEMHQQSERNKYKGISTRGEIKNLKKKEKKQDKQSHILSLSTPHTSSIKLAALEDMVRQKQSIHKMPWNGAEKAKQMKTLN